jgi:hypothetical protein
MDKWTPSESSIANAVDAREILINHKLSGENEKEIKFDDKWDRFVEAIKIVTGLPAVDALSNEEAWKHHFRDVIAATYPSEQDFSDALFQALRDSLGDFCCEPQPTSRIEPKSKKPEPILLQGCNIGFDTQVYRDASLGFRDNYGISTGSMVDHACVLFRDQSSNEGAGSLSKKQRPSKSRGAGTDDSKKATTGERFNDVTAAVALKHIYSSCADHNGTERLDLRKAIGQALMYTVDTWHCLRRRGPGLYLLQWLLGE